MATLTTLHSLLGRLQGYGGSDQLKQDAMQEVQESLRELNLSRRQFLREASSLGLSVTTVTSLGNWIGCTFMPTANHVDRLIEALEAILLAHDRLPLPAESLRESSHLHCQELADFQAVIQHLDQAAVGLEDTLVWLDLSEFPPSDGALATSFIPLTRQHGIERLQIIRSVQDQAAEATRFPHSLEHSLVAAKATIILSHFLLEVGEYGRALEAADEGAHTLADALSRAPHKKEEMTVSASAATWYAHISLAELELLGYLRRGNAFAALARQNRRLAARAELLGLAFESYRTALDKVDSVPNGTRRLKPGILREIAGLMLQRGDNLEEAEGLARQAATAYQHLAVPDDPLLYYLCRVTLARILLAQGKFAEAALALHEADQADACARERAWVVPGPLHRVMLLRTEAWYSLERARAAGRNSGERKQFTVEWQQKIIECLKRARTAGLIDQAWKIEQTIRTIDREFRPPVSDPPTSDQV